MSALSMTLIVLYVFVAPLSMLAGLLLGGPSRHSRLKWGALCYLAPPFVLIALLRRARGRTADNAPRTEPEAAPLGRARKPPTPVAVPALDDLRDVPEPILACPECAFLGVRPPGVQDGVWPGGGELIEFTCPRCDWRGLAVEFRRREEYLEFVQGLPRVARA